jgi:hypothetical protein
MNAPLKPHLKLKAIPMASEIIEHRSGGVPAHLRKLSEGTSFGNLDASDLKPPLLKLLAGQSPEVLDGVPDARPGNFWVTVLNQNIGTSVIGSPLMVRKSYQVWAPRGTNTEGGKGPLAVASDGINWDVPNLSFEIKYPMNPRTYTWKLGRTVMETGAHEWGTSQDDDPHSKPIAVKTFDVLWLIDLPAGEKQIVVFRSSRTGQQPTENMANAISARGVAGFLQRWRIVVKKSRGSSGDDFFAYDYQFVELIEDENEAMAMRALYDQYRPAFFAATVGGHDDAPARQAAIDPDSVPF